MTKKTKTPLNADDSEISLTFRKGLQVLACFDGQNRELTLPDIANHTGLNRAVVRRLVRTLLLEGMLEEQSGRYRMSVGVMRLTRGFIEGQRIATMIQPILRRTAEEVSESLSFSLRDRAEAVYVAHAPVKGSFTLNMVAVGTHVPITSTASGWAMLAHDADLDPGESGPSDEDLAAVRKLGYAFVEEGLLAGVNSLAVPVFRPSGKVHGAVSLIFPKGRYLADDVPGMLLAGLRQCASEVGSNL